MKYLDYNLYYGNLRRSASFYILYAICLIVLAWLVINIAGQWSNIIYTLNMTDHHLMTVLNFTGSAATDRFWLDFSRTATWIPLIATILFFILRKQQGNIRGAMLLLLAIGITMVLTDQISSSICKPFFARLRPSHDPSICYMLHYVNNYRGGQYGFVSSHAANVTGLVAWLCCIFRHRLIRMVFLLFAFMTCYSRIYLGVHFPGDVLMGSLLGFFIAWTVAKCFKKVLHARPITSLCPLIPIIFVLTMICFFIF